MHHTHDRLAKRDFSKELLEDMPKPLIYKSPLIFSCLFNKPLIETPKLTVSEAGAFELKASGDSVKAYGLLWVPNDPDLHRIDAIHHSQVCRILRKLMHTPHDFGREVIGGGYLFVDYDKRHILVFGQSGNYGRAPNFILQNAFTVADYHITIAGGSDETAHIGVSNMASATKWYLSKGIEIED